MIDLFDYDISQSADNFVTRFDKTAKECLNKLYSNEVNVVNDNVNHPSHYQGVGGLEASDVIKAFTGELKGYGAFCAGNAIKYILRWNRKNGKEDLRKAKWYIDELIKGCEVEGENGEHKEEPYDYTE